MCLILFKMLKLLESKIHEAVFLEFFLALEAKIYNTK
jgi:hypothetical protein